MTKLTSKQQKVLDVITDYYDTNERVPTLRHIATRLGFSSPSSVQNYIKILLDNGYLAKGRGGRSFRISYLAKPIVKIPVVGKIACGTPILSNENIEAYIPVDSRSLEGGASDYFFLKADDDSMNTTQINGKTVNEGDFVLIKKQSHAKENDKAAFLVNDRVILRQLKHESSFPVLCPKSTNSNHKKIILLDDPLIQGVAADVRKVKVIVEVIKEKK